ncbi:MAG TPA: WYL domain-containing protein [Acidimicrobiales bacterium]|nr:WYL domain-containing protein [Acidimicrobiales bacterium]
MARPSATDRLGRILAIVPWIAEQGAPLISDVCARFDLTPDELMEDLAVVPMVGLHPYTPDTLIELVVDDDRVSIEYGNFFERPLRLTQDEALVLLATATASAPSKGHDPGGPLARALDKLAVVVGVDLADDLQVVLDEPPGDQVPALEAAVRDREALRIGYFSHARNEHTERTIEPLRLFHTGGAWYLDAHCRATDEERVFRVDRITSIEATGERFDRRPARSSTEAFVPDPELPRVVLEVDAEGAWVAEQHPVEDRVDVGDGRQRLTLAVSATPWLERLLLRLGPHARVVEGPEQLRRAGADAARRLLGRYGDATGQR